MILGIGFVCSGCTSYNGNTSERVTAQNIRLLRIGMTPRQVEDVLGAPVAVESGDGGTTTLRYFRRLDPTTEMFVTSPKLFVNFRKGHVYDVYAKVNYHGDDEGVYWINENGTREEKSDFARVFRSTSTQPASGQSAGR